MRKVGTVSWIDLAILFATGVVLAIDTLKAVSRG